MNHDDDFPVEAGGIRSDGRVIVGVTATAARAKIEEGIARGRMLGALWELPNGDVAVAIAEPHASQKLIRALRLCADTMAQVNRPH